MNAKQELAEKLARGLGWVGARYYNGEYPWDCGCFPQDAKIKTRGGKTQGEATGGTYPFFTGPDLYGQLTVFSGEHGRPGGFWTLEDLLLEYLRAKKGVIKWRVINSLIDTFAPELKAESKRAKKAKAKR